MKSSFFSFWGVVLLMGGSVLPVATMVQARELHIDSRAGDDRNDGGSAAPLKTIARAISLAEAGDTLILVPGQPPLHEELKIENRSGAPGAPITFEGNGNVLDGSRQIVAEEWEKIRPGLYRNAAFNGFIPRGGSAEAMLRRFYFSFGGKMQRMGRAGKGANAALPPPEALKPGEWTYQAGEKAFYLAIPPETELADAGIRHPYLLNGLGARGDCKHWVIRNLKVVNFLNDGFNLHGQTADFRLEEIAAEACGDDGLSAHGKCEFEVDGFIASGNTTGICHVGSSRGMHRRLRLEGNVTYNLCLLGDGEHMIADSIVSARDGTIRFGSKVKAQLRVKLERLEILWPKEDARSGTSAPLEVYPGTEISTSGMPLLPVER